MRASASAPARHLRLRSILGWYHISHQPLASASSISIRGRASEVMESTKERRSSSPSFSIAPDQRRASGGGLWGAMGECLALERHSFYRPDSSPLVLDSKRLVNFNQPAQALSAAIAPPGAQPFNPQRSPVSHGRAAQKSRNQRIL